MNERETPSNWRNNYKTDQETFCISCEISGVTLSLHGLEVRLKSGDCNACRDCLVLLQPSL